MNVLFTAPETVHNSLSGRRASMSEIILGGLVPLPEDAS